MKEGKKILSNETKSPTYVSHIHSKETDICKWKVCSADAHSGSAKEGDVVPQYVGHHRLLPHPHPCKPGSVALWPCPGPTKHLIA